mgnify:FL=1
MKIFSASALFQTSILLYLFAAIAALVFIKQQKWDNIISNIICIIAAIFGIAASLMKILVEDMPINISIFHSTIPFISVELRIDHLSAFFVLSLSLLVVCVSLYSIGYISHYIGKRKVGLFNFLYSAFILSMFLVMTSGNAVFFLLTWEAMSLLSYFLVVFESEHEENQAAGTLYIIMTHVGTAFLMVGFMMMYSYTQSFDMFGSSADIPILAKNAMFIMFLIGFGTKAGVIPFHIWLPCAHPAAPSNVSALMSGIMIKTAIYGMLRFIFTYLGVQSTWWGALIIVLGIFSSTLGVSYAFVMANIKKLLAYSSIENIGIIFIGLGIGFIAQAQGHLTVSALAIIASLFHSFNHTLFKGSLFLGAGSIQYATHTKNMEELGGLIKKMPLTALFVLGGALSAASIVPFNGFIGEWLTYQSLFANIVPGQAALNILSILSVAVLAMTGAMAAASFVKLFGISFLGLPRSEQALQAKEVPCVMNIGTGILVTLCLFIGLFPLPILKVVDKVVLNLMGTSLIGQLQGGLLIAYYPLQISGNVISPLLFFVVLVAVILFALLVIRIIGGKYSERKYGTWDCGFEALNSRMQYSAAGFSNPIEIVFKILFRPSRKLKVEGKLAYHPESIEYTTVWESIFEKHLYNPIFYVIKMLSRRTKFIIQTGSIHSYLLYIFVVVLVLMMYNTFV